MSSIFERVYELTRWCKSIHREEITDIAIYLIRICMKLDINLEEAILNEMTKNEAMHQISQVEAKI